MAVLTTADTGGTFAPSELRFIKKEQFFNLGVLDAEKNCAGRDL